MIYEFTSFLLIYEWSIDFVKKLKKNNNFIKYESYLPEGMRKSMA